jgi:hypothetical protein
MKTTPCKILFVYGGADPWTGAAIADDIILANPNISKLTVFEGTHTDFVNYWTDKDKQKLYEFLDPFLK